MCVCVSTCAVVTLLPWIMVTVVDVTHLLFTTNASRIRAIRATGNATAGRTNNGNCHGSRETIVSSSTCTRLYVIAIVCWDRPLSVKTDKSFLHRRSTFGRADRAWHGVIISRLAGPLFFAASSTCVFLPLLPAPCYFRFRLRGTIAPRISVQFHTHVKIIESAVLLVFCGYRESIDGLNYTCT